MLFPKDLIASDESSLLYLGLTGTTQEVEAELVFFTERLVFFLFFDTVPSLTSQPKFYESSIDFILIYNNYSYFYHHLYSVLLIVYIFLLYFLCDVEYTWRLFLVQFYL